MCASQIWVAWGMMWGKDLNIVDLNILETPRYWKFNVLSHCFTIYCFYCWSHITVQERCGNSNYFVHIASNRKEGDIREGKISSVKTYCQVTVLTISAMSHWQGICLIFGGPNLTLKKTRRISLLRDNYLSSIVDTS